MASMTREFQFAAIKNARSETLAWAAAEGIPLHKIEFIVPFVENDFSLDVWLFFQTDADLAALRQDGRHVAVEKRMLQALAAEDYPAEWLANVAFYSDSHENVQRNYEGSYFYRLR